MKTTTMLFVIIFLTLSSPALGDIEVLVRADLSKIQTSEGKYSKEIAFKGGKAVLSELDNFYVAFYSSDALNRLAEPDSTTVILALGKSTVTPSFGELYIVQKRIGGDIGFNVYGLDPEIYYAWPIDFLISGIGLKDKNGNVCHKGVAPCGDDAIKYIKENYQKITKNFFASLEN